MSKKKRRLLIILSVTVVLGTAAFLAADRYLIRHVEIADVNAYADTAYSAAAPEANDENITAVSQAESTDIEEETSSQVNTIIYDDWSYQSDNVSISITEHSSGSGRDALTYYVADVTISDATLLKNAFADKQFGLNIIAYTSDIAEENNAIFAINGDYYGFREDGIIIRNGILYRDEPARIGLAFYRDGNLQIYDETQTSAEELLAAGVWNTLSFGPALLEDGQIVEGISEVEVDTNFGNHSIQGNQPRTGIGIIDDNHFVFIVADGRSRDYSTGVTMTEFAQLFRELGCSSAYNLDGGGSSTMYFMGRVVNNPLGKNKERGTSDILYIGAEE
jgi:exopolysaccharide biosynthesis protein